MQILHTEIRENISFQHHICLYNLEQETFLQTTVRFVNIVENCILYEETKLSKILPWSCHSDSNPKALTLTLKEIYDFIKVNADESKSDETWKKLTNILKKEYSLFKSNGENDFEQGILNECKTTTDMFKSR